ncbi:MAG: hypothetical protein ACRCX8_19715 [Sarcina sp.]
MSYSDGDIVVSHDKVRIIKTFHGYQIREKNYKGEWERPWGCSEWFVLGSEVLDEFKYFVLKHSK